MIQEIKLFKALLYFPPKRRLIYMHLQNFTMYALDDIHKISPFHCVKVSCVICVLIELNIFVPNSFSGLVVFSTQRVGLYTFMYICTPIVERFLLCIMFINLFESLCSQ